MLTLKQTILRIFFGLEIVVFLCVYLLGAQGIQFIQTLKRENSALTQEIKNLSECVQNLEQEILAWNNTTFYKEQYAREKLQMAKENEIIFYLDKADQTT